MPFFILFNQTYLKHKIPTKQIDEISVGFCEAFTPCIKTTLHYYRNLVKNYNNIFILVAHGWIRTTDLQFMRLTR